MAEQAQSAIQSVNPITAKFNEMTRRIRNLEDKLSSFEDKLEMVDKSGNMKLDSHENAIVAMVKHVKGLQSESKMVKRELKALRKEVMQAAPIAKIKELEGYINMIDPMKFVTRDEVKHIIEKYLEMK